MAHIDPGEPNPEFSEEKITEDHKLWCEKYVHVWSDLSKGAFDRKAVEEAADEHWQHSPKSDPVMVATMAFIKGA